MYSSIFSAFQFYLIFHLTEEMIRTFFKMQFTKVLCCAEFKQFITGTLAGKQAFRTLLYTLLIFTLKVFHIWRSITKLITKLFYLFLGFGRLGFDIVHLLTLSCFHWLQINKLKCQGPAFHQDLSWLLTQANIWSKQRIQVVLLTS